ncbi:MAG: MFS transporter [Zetaproteobacteria bacterium]|nr:MAG: MFS transporter [Zetaproteobacteria bacterium]
MPDTEHTAPDGSRDFLAVATAQFAMAFALNFMFVFLPFYIRAVSDIDEAATLRWTGLILGAAAATATFGSAFWGNLSDRFSPKALFERGLASHVVLVTAMAFTADVRLLLAIRLVQGFLGGISTIGLIIVSAISSEAQRARRLGSYQSALTLGQIFGPPLGALGADALGFRGAFLASAAMLLCVLVFSHLALTRIPPQPRRPDDRAVSRRHLLLAWVISLVATMHIVFLPSILPAILRDFDVPEARRLVSAGTIVFAYGVASAAGSYGFSRLAGRVAASKLVLFAAMGASACQVLLFWGTNVATFTLIRMIQTACAAGIFPLILAQVAAHGRGRIIGFINTARFAGMALGPVAATFILAHAGLLALYAVLGAALALAAAGEYLTSPDRRQGVEA